MTAYQDPLTPCGMFKTGAVFKVDEGILVYKFFHLAALRVDFDFPQPELTSGICHLPVTSHRVRRPGRSARSEPGT